MFKPHDHSLSSLGSSHGTHSSSVVNPEQVSTSNLDETFLQQNVGNTNYQHLNELFTVFCKAKKEIFLKINSERIIHVVHYAQEEYNLYDENTHIQPSDENYDNTVLLFLIHGVGGSTTMWDPQVNYFLSQGYEILSIDLLGHGLSAAPRDFQAYQFKALANDVLTIFDKFHKRRNVVIGHSYGSSFCTLLSKERANRVYKTVLISGGGPTTLTPETFSAFCLPLPIFMCIQSSLVKMFRRMAFHVDTTENIRKRIATFQISSFALKAIMQGQHWLEADEDYHAGLTVPVLLIYGRGDKFVSLEEELWMQETIYGAQLEVIDNAGHMVILETPTRVNELIHNFLNRDTSTRSTSEVETDRDRRIVNDEVTETRNAEEKLDYAPSDSMEKSYTSFRSHACLSRNSIRLSRASLRSTRKTMF